ncbi:MAG: hypothetical protein JXO51_03850 [Candidatus Aminicenantes bacterium]|nr:hypothetical protein [Candidatus Aminicenantes bacterium]
MGRHLALAISILGLAALLAGAARPLKLDFYGHYGYSWLSPRKDSPWNPGPVHVLASCDSALLLQIDGRLRLGKAVFCASPQWRAAHDGTWKTGLREATLNVNLGNFDLTAGKTLIRMGTGYMFTPISVITPDKSLADPEDNGHEQEGVWLLKADYYRESFSLGALVFKKNNWSNLALFGYVDAGRVDLYAILFHPEYRKLEFGLAAAGTLGESVELHAEIMVRRRSPVLRHRAFSVPFGAALFPQWPLFQPPDRCYPEILLGANVTFKGVNVIAEYYHADWGITAEEYRRLQGHYAISLSELPGPLAQMNLAADLELLQAGSRGMMRDYFFARLWKALKGVSLTAVGFVNLSDGSFLSLVEASWFLSDGITLYIRPLYFSGSQGDEFGDSVYSAMLQAGFSVRL